MVVADKHGDEATPSSLPPWPSGLGARIGHALMLAPRMPFVWFMRSYRAAVSPLYPRVCRYYPSCSKYALDAFEVKGAVLGVVLTGWRVLRCNPWSRGGVDYVPGSVLARRSAALRAQGSAADNGTIDRVPDA